VKVWCLYSSARHEGCSGPEHFFDVDALIERLSHGVFGADDIYINEINTRTKEVTTVFSAVNTTYRYRVEDTRKLQEDVRKAVIRVV
jgi:hypothetical protein